MAVLAGCYSAHPQEGAACAAGGLCPDPLVCMRGSCYEKGTVIADGPPDAFECKAIGGSGGMVTAPFVTRAPVIDGDISDWQACFVTLDMANNPYRDLGETTWPTGKFSIEHDASSIYLAIEVQGVLPLGDQPIPAIYENDSVSFYLDGDGVFTDNTYGADGIQLVIDHANRVQAFRTASVVTTPSITSATTESGSTYTIELAVTPATFGLQAFGDSIGIDIGIEGGDGMKQTSEVMWYQACELPLCGCKNGTTSAPYCDEREFGRAELSGP
ncbi:MAG: sugar-binding protein [Kofleriaceae bacterium]